MAKSVEELNSAIKKHITGGAHVAVACKDIDESIRFYTEILGFKVTQDIFVGSTRLVFVTHENLVVELIYFKDRKVGADGSSYDLCAGRGRIMHICLLAEEDGMQEMLDNFKALDVPIFEELRYNPTVKGVHRQGSYCFFILGPDGELIEFNS